MPFIAEGQSDPELLLYFRERFLKPCRQSLKVIWQRGVARGEIHPEVDGDLVLDLIFGPMVYRLLVGHGPLDENQAKAIIRAVFRGVRIHPDSDQTTTAADHALKILLQPRAQAG